MRKTTVLLIEAEPVLSQGIAIALQETDDLCFIGACASIAVARELAGCIRPDVIVDLQPEPEPLLDLLYDLGCVVVLVGWGSEAPNLRWDTAVLAGDRSLEDLIVMIREASLVAEAPRPLVGAAVARRRPAEPPDDAAPRPAALHDLTEREAEVFELLVRGLDHRAIAKELHLALNTVRSHTRHIHLKFNVHTDLGAVACVLGEDERDPNPTEGAGDRAAPRPERTS